MLTHPCMHCTWKSLYPQLCCVLQCRIRMRRHRNITYQNVKLQISNRQPCWIELWMMTFHCAFAQLLLLCHESFGGEYASLTFGMMLRCFNAVQRPFDCDIRCLCNDATVLLYQCSPSSYADFLFDIAVCTDRRTMANQYSYQTR